SDVTECVTVHLVSASPYKPGDLFTVPVTREEDAELIWLIARILDATATDLIYLLYSDRFTEWAECRGCMPATALGWAYVGQNIYSSSLSALLRESFPEQPLQAVRRSNPAHNSTSVIYDTIFYSTNFTEGDNDMD
ncbi:hypothetical protein GBF38_002116, partial [Nibea albiflora]